MSTNQTNLQPVQVSHTSQAPSAPADHSLPPKTPLKGHFSDTVPNIYAFLSPLAFAPKMQVRSSDLFFTPFSEMREIATPLPKERVGLMVEGEKDPIDLAITGQIIFESEGEDPNSNSEEEESSELQEDPSCSKSSSQEGNSEPSESHSPQDEGWRKEESKSRRTGKPRGSVSGGREGTPSGKRVQCNCRKSKCLKLYCDCFRLNLTCDGCNCVGCHNLESYAEERNNAIISLMDRNPDPFGVKIEDHRHVKGCNCKKSGCQKKYCECYQAGLTCGDNCKCEDCKNCPNEKHDSDHERPAARNTAKKERRMVEI